MQLVTPAKPPARNWIHNAQSFAFALLFSRRLVSLVLSLYLFCKHTSDLLNKSYVKKSNAFWGAALDTFARLPLQSAPTPCSCTSSAPARNAATPPIPNPVPVAPLPVTALSRFNISIFIRPCTLRSALRPTRATKRVMGAETEPSFIFLRW